MKTLLIAALTISITAALMGVPRIAGNISISRTRDRGTKGVVSYFLKDSPTGMLRYEPLCTIDERRGCNIPDALHERNIEVGAVASLAVTVFDEHNLHKVASTVVHDPEHIVGSRPIELLVVPEDDARGAVRMWHELTA